jgi:DNA mismatch repair protein MutS2
VRVPKWKSTGTVLELFSDGKVKVALGTLQMTLTPAELEPLLKSELKTVKANLARKKSSSHSFEAPAPDPKIDLRGLRLEEAMSQFQAWIDQSFRSGATVEVIVVHGIGTGVIREAVRALLGKLPYVKEFRDGGAGHGGTGATIVEFDRA